MQLTITINKQELDAAVSRYVDHKYPHAERFEHRELFRSDVTMMAEAFLHSRQWLTEPTGEGWYWVAKRGPAFVRKSPTRGWVVEGAGGARPLNGRRVCPILVPPEEDP